MAACSDMEPVNIYFVVTHPIQYFVPLYQHLSKKENVHVKVFFFSDETLKGGLDKQFGVKFTWDIPLLEGYEYTFVKNRSWKPSISKGFWGLFNPGIISALWRLPKGMVIINGWQNSSYVMSFLCASFRGHRVAISCDAPVYKEFNRKGIKNAVRKVLVGNWLLNRIVDKCLYIGSQSKAFYRHHKVPESKLVFTPFTIDNSRFEQGAASFNRLDERRSLGIEATDFVILYTGKFIEVKRPMDLIMAFQKLRIPNKYLVLVGEGNLRDSMEAYIAEHKIDRVYFTGFVNQSELPKYYGLADVLVLCSETETWGLSVNEAMACGLPVIVSDTVGCADDLLVHGKNGFIFPKGDLAALEESMFNVSQDIVKGNRMGQVSQAIIQGFTLEKTAEGILAAATAAHG
jgi:glycosyltransferase involved in cell wall biosynthesis